MLEKELECGMVVCADDPKLLDKLDQAAEKGELVEVTHIKKTFDICFYLVLHDVVVNLVPNMVSFQS